MKLRIKLKEYASKAWNKIEDFLKRICVQPAPMTRFILVLIMGGMLAAASIFFIFNSFYNMGKHDAEKKFLEFQHIQPLEMQAHNDSITKN